VLPRLPDLMSFLIVLLLEWRSGHYEQRRCVPPLAQFPSSGSRQVKNALRHELTMRPNLDYQTNVELRRTLLVPPERARQGELAFYPAADDWLAQ
jgi:hypothetical protein